MSIWGWCAWMRLYIRGWVKDGWSRLVVAVLAVADQVDDDILLELGTPVGGELTHEVNGLNVVGIDVEDRSVDGLGDVGAVGRRAGESGIGGEADLVVDDEVDGAAGGEGGEEWKPRHS